MEIYFSDLTEEAQQKFLAYMEMASEKEGNFDVFPIGIVGN